MEMGENFNCSFFCRLQFYGLDTGDNTHAVEHVLSTNVQDYAGSVCSEGNSRDATQAGLEKRVM